MNRRIRELAIEADAWCDQNVKDDAGYNAEWEQRFAELIVRECIDWCNVYTSTDGTAEKIAIAIKEHFGVDKD